MQDNLMFMKSNLIFPLCFVGLIALFTFSLPDGHRLLLKKEIMEQQILKYRIDRLLGEGGMSRVWLGVDPVTGQRVAIKVLHPHLADHNKIRALFLQEAESLAKLDHPGIVMLVDYNPEQLVLVQQYIDGMDLEEYITHHRGPIPEEEAKELFCKMLDAFAYVHSNKVIHRDIKPANILMTRGNHIKVVDFGIAKETETGRDTSTGTPMGTIPYMSPEQIKSNPGEKIDHRTDIYSLGVLLHQMLTGKPPYDTQKESLFDIQLKIVQEPLPRMQGIYEYVSKEMQAVVDKATAKDRNKRYQSCEEFLRAVKALKPPSSPPSKPDWREWLRDKRVMAGAGVLLLIMVSLFALNFMPKGAEPLVEAPVAAPAAVAVVPPVAVAPPVPVAVDPLPQISEAPAPVAEVIKHKIGERYGGGIIFYVDATGQRGLIAAESDLPGGEIYTWEAAKKACRELVKNGQSDWRLPTKEELNKLYKKRSAVGGFASDVYWSSSEYNAYYAWYQDFVDGYQVVITKSIEWRVRPVRAFTH